MSKLTTIPVMVLGTCLLAACGGSATMEESQLLEFAKAGFHNLPPDYGLEVFNGHPTDLAGISYDSAWNAALEVAVQRGVVVRADRQSGVIVVMSGQLMVPHYDTEFPVSVAGTSSPTLIGIRPTGANGTRIYLGWKEELMNSKTSPQTWTMSASAKQDATLNFVSAVVVTSLWPYKWTYLEAPKL